LLEHVSAHAIEEFNSRVSEIMEKQTFVAYCNTIFSAATFSKLRKTISRK
jgi:hypothetical protein